MSIKSKIKITANEHHKFVPYAFEFDFETDIKNRGLTGRVDKGSVCVTRMDGGYVHFYLSDDFLFADKGKINFLIENTDICVYLLSYETGGDGGTYSQKDYIGLVGNGDCLRYNTGRPQPIYNGMYCEPHLADIDGDGVEELISGQPYSTVIGRKWHLVNAFRNLGTDAKPVWGEGVPLRCEKDGEIIFMGGSSIFMADLSGNGLPDIISCGYGGYNADSGVYEIYFHSNTGKKDVNGFPLYKYLGAAKIKSSYISSLNYIDLLGDGSMGFLITHFHGTEIVERSDPLWFDCSEEEKATVEWPRWGMMYKCEYFKCEGFDSNGVPVLGDGREIICESVKTSVRGYIQLTTIGKDRNGNTLVMYSINNENASNYSRDMSSHLVCMRYTGNNDAKGRLIFEKLRVYDYITAKPSMSVAWADGRVYKGVIMTKHLGGACTYYPLTGYDENGAPLLSETEHIIYQTNPFLNPNGSYSSGMLVDLDNDGNLDIVCGNESGYTVIIRNCGTMDKPRYMTPEYFRYNGEILHMMNGAYDDPRGMGEAGCGQISAYWIDMNFDGKPDLVIKVGRRTYLYENAGTRSNPELLAPVELRTENGAPLGMHRNGPMIGEFTGSGCPDVICDSPDNMERLNLYRGFKNKNGKLCFKDAEALKYADGTIIRPMDWHRYTKFWKFGDYFGNGKHDLIFSTCNFIYALENVGTNENPVFNKAVEILDADGNSFEIGHHISMPELVDWDGAGHRDLLIYSDSGLFHLLRQNYLNGVFKTIFYKTEAI